MLEARPTCDKIIHNSTEVSYPYFRADSFLGSLYIRDTGMYNVQVISDKILPKENRTEGPSTVSNTKLLSIVLTPTTH
jgi:phenolic acid decarboxylase